MAGVWYVYVAECIIAFVLSNAALMATGWTTSVMAAPDFNVTGFMLLDILVVFFRDAYESWASRAMLEAVLSMATAAIFSFVAEGSRRRCSVRQGAVGSLALVGQFLGVGAVLPGFLAMLNQSKPKQIPEGEPVHEIHVMRAFYNLGCALSLLLLGFILVPLTTDELPGGTPNPVVTIIMILAPAVPPLAYAFDKTSRGDFPTHNPREQRLSDREIAHYVVMATCVITAVLGLYSHIRFIGTMLFYDTPVEFWADILENPAALFLLVDETFLILACYTWLHFEALKPANIEAGRKEDTSRLLSFADVLAICAFGPTTHFSIAFAGREYGLMKLDNLRAKNS